MVGWKTTKEDNIREGKDGKCGVVINVKMCKCENGKCEFCI
jgi:hypothetical protein